MRDVLGRMTTGAVKRILDSVNPSAIKSLTESEEKRGHSERDEGAQVPQ